MTPHTLPNPTPHTLYWSWGVFRRLVETGISAPLLRRRARLQMSLGKPHKTGNAEQTRRLAALTAHKQSRGEERGGEEGGEEDEQRRRGRCRSAAAFPDHSATCAVTRLLGRV